MALVYSCCFWFSLRLGGILIGLFSIIQELFVLVLSLNAYYHINELKDLISHWKNIMQLIYTEAAIEHIIANLERYVTLVISLTCMYITLCIFYIYGALKCNTVWMPGYIFGELLRLIMMVFFVTTWLLILKENSTDIGLLIGASVTSGFILLGMFYLWICAASLPLLINEEKKDKLTAAIAKLRRLLSAYQNFNGERFILDEFSSRY